MYDGFLQSPNIFKAFLFFYQRMLFSNVPSSKHARLSVLVIALIILVHLWHFCDGQSISILFLEILFILKYRIPAIVI